MIRQSGNDSCSSLIIICYDIVGICFVKIAILVILKVIIIVSIYRQQTMREFTMCLLLHAGS